MGKYTIRDDWPVELQIAAANVIRAKLAKKWRKRAALRCDTVQQFKYCQDNYISADTRLRRAKAIFDDMRLIYLDERQ